MAEDPIVGVLRAVVRAPLVARERPIAMDVVVACGIQHAYFGKTGTRYLGDKADILKVRVGSFLAEERARGSVVFAAREVHQPNDPFYRQMKSHSVVGTEDIEIPEAFKPYISSS